MRTRERVDCKEHKDERWLRAVGGSGALKPCESIWAAASGPCGPGEGKVPLSVMQTRAEGGNPGAGAWSRHALGKGPWGCREGGEAE